MPEEIYSPGLEGVIAGETAISTVSGGLSYRGYLIEDLARYGVTLQPLQGGYASAFAWARRPLLEAGLTA